MSDLYLFEAGATKTDLIYVVDGEKKELNLPGFNPNRDISEFVGALSELKNITGDSYIHFYGAGLGSQQNKNVVKEIFNTLESGRIKVYDDILGASRAAFKDTPGIICIMGTGGLAAYYDGKDILKRRGGYGYLIDDLGGGIELGKRVLSAWINGDLSESCSNEIQSFVQEDKVSFLVAIYKSRDLKLISAVAKHMATIEDESLQKVVDQYFKDFFEQNVLPLAADYELNNYSIIGSIGAGYYRSIRQISNSFDLKLEQCIQSPIQRLFDFHLQKR